MKIETLGLWWSLLTLGFASALRLVYFRNLCSIRNRAYRDQSVAGRQRYKLAITICLLVSLGGAQIVFARSKGRTNRLALKYALNKNIRDTDGTEMRRELLSLLSRPDIRLFLEVIQEAEGGEPNLMVGGCRAKDLSQHPGLSLPRRCFFPVKINGHWRYSTASGSYQITLTNWRRIATFLGLRDFSVNSQMLAALELIRSGGPKSQAGFLNLVQGHLNSALCQTTQPWASSSCSTLPGHPKKNFAHLAEKLRQRNAELAKAASRPGNDRYRVKFIGSSQSVRSRRT